MNGIEIVSTGYAKIEKTLDNQQLEQMVGAGSFWLPSRAWPARNGTCRSP